MDKEVANVETLRVVADREYMEGMGLRVAPAVSCRQGTLAGLRWSDCDGRPEACDATTTEAAGYCWPSAIGGSIGSEIYRSSGRDRHIHGRKRRHREW